jgi:beta-glucosidase
MYIKPSLVILLVCISFATLCQKQPADDVQARIEALVAQMTVEEKVGQLNFLVGETIVTGPTFYTANSEKFDELIKKGKITGLFNVHGAAYTGRLQKIAVEESRLKIPLLFGADVIHGFKTVTPLPLAEAASWDLALIEKSAGLAAREASSAGINFNFAPMVDISRDPRWGRVSEGAGEDPFLGCEIAKARVKGFQGNSLSAPNTVAACVKHFAAYGAVEAGRDYNTADMSERVLKEIYFPPYKAAIDAGAATVMTSFNELDGIPATANKKLIQDVLRNEWKFDGPVVSDYGSIGELIPHGVAATQDEAAQKAFEAGTDVDMMSYLFQNKIPGLVQSGKVDVKYLDAAVRRVLKLKFDLGLFNNPYLYSDPKREQKELRSKENVLLSKEIGKRSIVLLKNENEVLPIGSSIKNIALIGPLADAKAEMNGSWSFFGDVSHPVSILEGMKKRAGRNINVNYEPGCSLYDNSTDKLNAAVSVARNSDLVVLVVGESAVMNGEGASRADIGLPGVQLDLVKAIVATGKPVVVLLVNGRPLAIEWIDQNVPSIVETWTLGSEAGHAIAEILFGDYSPSGKLPMTFPRHVGQIPIYYNYKNTGRPYQGDYNEPQDQRIYQSKYRDVKNSPLYPFGYGLSYTKFSYSEVQLSSPMITVDDKLVASITVTNTGSREGEEVVQLYIRDLVGSVTRPVKELKGFQKISLKPGESKKISFTIDKNTLSFYRSDMSWGAEPGKFEVFIGGSSADVKKQTFELKDLMVNEG